MLTLKRVCKSRPSGEWSDDDYDVFDSNRHIGQLLVMRTRPAEVVLDDHGARSEQHA